MTGICEAMWSTNRKDEGPRRHACMFEGGHPGRIHYCAGCGDRHLQDEPHSEGAVTDGDR